MRGNPRRAAPIPAAPPCADAAGTAAVPSPIPARPCLYRAAAEPAPIPAARGPARYRAGIGFGAVLATVAVPPPHPSPTLASRRGYRRSDGTAVPTDPGRAPPGVGFPQGKCAEFFRGGQAPEYGLLFLCSA